VLAAPSCVGAKAVTKCAFFNGTRDSAFYDSQRGFDPVWVAAAAQQQNVLTSVLVGGLNPDDG
jgi:hypothetical protein